jgi:hypothetical protein
MKFIVTVSTKQSGLRIPAVSDAPNKVNVINVVCTFLFAVWEKKMLS